MATRGTLKKGGRFAEGPKMERARRGKHAAGPKKKSSFSMLTVEREKEEGGREGTPRAQRRNRSEFTFPEEEEDEEEDDGSSRYYRKGPRELSYQRGEGGVCLIDLERGQCCVNWDKWDEKDEEGNPLSCQDGFCPSECEEMPHV